MHIAWTSSSGQCFHPICSHWPANAVWPRCPVLPQDSPAHSTPIGCYSGVHKSHHHLSKPVPGIFLMACNAMNLPTDPWHHTQPSQGNLELPWCGIPPRSGNQVHLWTQQALQVGTAQHLAAVRRVQGDHISQRKICSAVEWLANSWSRGHPWAASLREEKATEIWACQHRKNHIHSVGTEKKVHSKIFKSPIIQSILSWDTGHGMITVSQRRECFVAFQILYKWCQHSAITWSH